MSRIVVGVDGSARARHALQWAADEARSRHATLEVVHAWSIPVLDEAAYGQNLDPEMLEEAAREVLERELASVDTAGLELTRALPAERAAKAILEAAKGADLLVVGSRGRGGFAGLLLGSVSNQVVRHAPCPVVVVPPPAA